MQKWPIYGTWFELAHCIPVIVQTKIINLSNFNPFLQIPYELPAVILKQAVYDFLVEINELP